MLFGITRFLAESRPKGKDYMINRGVIMIAGPSKGIWKQSAELERYESLTNPTVSRNRAFFS